MNQSSTALADFPVYERNEVGSIMLPKLTIVIPALNEEESIGSTVERCLAARPRIMSEGGVRDVEIIVVNDGSTDKTSAIAHQLAENHEAVRVIDFPVNRGYGAALKEGFQQGTGELVSFLDADGTCDPGYFTTMCRQIQDQSAAVVLGSRMGQRSQMPRIRRLGNRMFALLLGVFSGRAVTDTASGMRVIRREALNRLYPLPDGLQFTPAMSARALMDDMKIVEVEMDYAERVGESKLHVLRDGVRFLAAIGGALMLYRPSRIFKWASILCTVIALAWILYPVEFYLRNWRLEETMIYRVLLCSFLLTSAFVFLAGSVLADQILDLVYPQRSRSFVDASLSFLMSPGKLAVGAVITALAAFSLVFTGLLEYALTAHTSLHWSRAIVAVMLLQLSLVSVVTAILRCVMRLWMSQVTQSRNN